MVEILETMSEQDRLNIVGEGCREEREEQGVAGGQGLFVASIARQ